MKTLYVTDLDGTLLRSDTRLSAYTVETINAMVAKGMIFTYATARSEQSAQRVCQGLDMRIPVIVYNVPSRTGVNLLPSTMLRLSDVKNIVGIKEASGNIEQLQELVRITRGKTDVYLGEDSLTYLGMTLGSKGVISVAANVAPLLMREITENAENGNYAAAREAQLKALPLIRALFSEVNPIPVKKAMNFLGFDAGVPRLPLTEMEEAHAAALYGEMQALGLVK